MFKSEEPQTIEYTHRPHDALTKKILGAAIEVHRALGPGLLESSYETCLMYELRQIGLKIEQQKAMPIEYKGIKLDSSYRVGLLIEEKVILEIKSVAELNKIHDAQLITYLKLSGFQVGLLMNFNVRILKHGIRRIIL